jgi:hypothetical protein
LYGVIRYPAVVARRADPPFAGLVNLIETEPFPGVAVGDPGAPGATAVTVIASELFVKTNGVAEESVIVKVNVSVPAKFAEGVYEIVEAVDVAAGIIIVELADDVIDEIL